MKHTRLLTLACAVLCGAVHAAFLDDHPQWEETIKSLEPAHRHALMGVIAVGQGERLLGPTPPAATEDLAAFCEPLAQVDAAYASEGGIVGYHRLCLSLLKHDESSQPSYSFGLPPHVDLRKASNTTRRAAQAGLTHLPEMAELFVVGGAADRLALIDPKSKSPLPGCCLPFCGFTLLEGLFRDLTAREYLAYKLTGKQSITPVVMMTSSQKDNHQHILEICERTHYFGRPKGEVLLVTQPQVPVVSVNGDWCSTGPLQLALKPGGHGALWPTMERSGAYKWLEERGRRGAIIRQLNNPLAGLDDTLLAFYGIGVEEAKTFAFMGCSRKPGESRGIDVLVVRPHGEGEEAAATCIEYTEVDRMGLAGDRGAGLPGNTNLLYADLQVLRPLLRQSPYPQLVMNLKHRFPNANLLGEVEEISGGRLESLVQGVGQLLFQPIPKDASDAWLRKHLQTLVVLADRDKIYSPIKRQRANGPVDGYTPEHAFYDLQREHRRMLETSCGFEMPPFPSLDLYSDAGLSCVVLYHPALGPSYSVIGQKLRGGSLSDGSFLRLEIAEIDIEKLWLHGGLEVIATAPLGPRESEAGVRFGDLCGKCRLHRVRVENGGLGDLSENLWKGDFSDRPALRIVIHGSGEFEAKDVCFRGDQTITVPDGVLLRVTMAGDELKFETLPIAKPSWHWTYSFDESGGIRLQT